MPVTSHLMVLLQCYYGALLHSAFSFHWPWYVASCPLAGRKTAGFLSALLQRFGDGKLMSLFS